MKVHRSMTPLSDVLYEFSLAKPTPDAEVLDEFVRRYPEYAGALTDLAVGIVLDSARGDDSDAAENFEPVVSQGVSRAMSRFQNRLFELQQKDAGAVTGAGAHSSSVGNPFTTLDRNEFRALAKRLKSNTVFVGMLRDREIDPTTMSEGFVRLVANEIRAPLELVAAHFAAQSEAQRGQFYKAEEKPHLGPKVSFEDAVRNRGSQKNSRAIS